MSERPERPVLASERQDSQAVAATSDPPGYDVFAAALQAEGILADPWLSGRPRFAMAPVVLSRTEYETLAGAAEQVAAVFNHAAVMASRDESIAAGFLRLTAAQRAMWQASAPLWHGIARADAFFTDEGVRICELNCDTPSGEPEAVLLGARAAREAPEWRDPSAYLEQRLCTLIEHAGSGVRGVGCAGALRIGIVYPTEVTEDLPMIELYRRWFEARQWRVVLGSPFNLNRLKGGRVGLLGEPCDVIVRHYKTDWWGERLPVWDDEEPYPDAEPLTVQLALLLDAMLDRRVAVVNPPGAVLPQNKRTMAFMWEEMARFPVEAREIIRRFIPETRRLESVPRQQLLEQQAAWVLKSDYGCEGDEVIIGAEVAPDSWRASLEHALPQRWIVQRRFEARRDRQGRTTNHGVFLVAGQTAGLYTRLSRGATDITALSAATLVMP